jgi:transcription antitermination factor NusG
MLFPGYILVNTSLKNYSALKYTMGIKNIIKFGVHIPHISNEEIEDMRMVEETSKINPITSQINIGQDAVISKGLFKGSVVKVCSLPSKERVGVLIAFLGSMQKVDIPKTGLIF